MKELTISLVMEASPSRNRTTNEERPMFRPTLHTLCALVIVTFVTLTGCKTGQKAAKSPSNPQPSSNAYAQQHNHYVPPSPARTAARPRLLPGGPSTPLAQPPATPSRRTTTPTSRTNQSSPSLPLPAPPAEDF